MEINEFVRKVIEDKNRFNIGKKERRLKSQTVIQREVAPQKQTEPFRREVYGVKYSREEPQLVDVDMGIVNNVNLLMRLEEVLKHNFKTYSILVQLEREHLSEELLLNGMILNVGGSFVLDMSFEKELLMKLIPEENTNIILEVIFIGIHKNFNYDRMIEWIRMELNASRVNTFVDDYMNDRDFKPTIELITSYLTKKMRDTNEIVVGWYDENAMVTAPYNLTNKNRGI